jgi:hypothetical protein
MISQDRIQTKYVRNLTITIWTLKSEGYNQKRGNFERFFGDLLKN